MESVQPTKDRLQPRLLSLASEFTLKQPSGHGRHLLRVFSRAIGFMSELHHLVLKRCSVYVL